MIFVSACLAGVKTRYDGTDRLDEKIRALVVSGAAIPLCPEVLGGRGIPRETIEITGGDGAQVLSGRARVVDQKGGDHTKEILEGVDEFIKAAKAMGVAAVILKTKSPTCGHKKIYDGTFTGKLIDGSGVLSAALEKESIKIYTEENCGELLK
ncbi:MAG: DUF523 domain-containing protein [Candidatus Goldiibacteriota bacterium]|jgi:uncharacterized protein YbbK (DUF523 family)